MAVTASMAFAGFEAARAAIERLISGGLAVEPGLPMLVLVVSAVIKAGMYYRIRWIARLLSSPTLATAAQDNLSDVLTSSAAFLGALGSSFIHPMLDAAGGILVALWIFRNVYRAARENLGFLTGAGADEDLRIRMVSEVASVPGVLRVHHLMSEYTGPRVVVDLHVNVDGAMTLEEAHQIADEVITRLEAMPEVDRAYVHIEPEGYE
jgi:cation diffusion facilitator family transporter